ncbi:MAG: phytanoyl-CoA dioxygenase family protein, partial [Pseudomonadota bacterium]|nr:phytanoyl-CoA dioxygenase family protein [Pseudomonadota bacterium]
MQDIYPSRHADVAEFLPRLDPVVHSDWSEDAPISRAQAEQFDRDGYLVLEDIFSDAEVAFLQREAGKLLADPQALEDETVITEPGGKEVRSIFKIHAQSDVIGRLAADSRLAGVAQ